MANDDLGHSAMPKLYGAPAYARPPLAPVQPVERPFDPDALPIEADLTSEEREIMSQLPPRPYDGAAPAGPMAAQRDGVPRLRGRPFRFRRLADRLKGSDRPRG